MNNNSKTCKIISESTFIEAFLKLFKCNREDIEIEITDENRSAFVIYQEQPYQIHTRESLFDEVKTMLTNSDEAQLINLSIWLEVSIGLLSNGQFYLNLVNLLNDPEDFQLVHVALGISSFAKDDDEEVFWRTLRTIDKTGILFGNAIIAAAKVYDLDRLADDILDSQIINGHIVYNQFVDGMFEEVTIGDDENWLDLYIFSADGGNWSA